MLVLLIISFLVSFVSCATNETSCVYYNIKYGDNMTALSNSNKTVEGLIYKANPILKIGAVLVQGTTLCIPSNLISSCKFCPSSNFQNKTIENVPYIMKSGETTMTITNSTTNNNGTLTTGLIIANKWQCPHNVVEGYLLCIPKYLYNYYNLKK
jgi:hypothetical protein